MIAFALATLLAAGHQGDSKSFRVSATPSVEVANLSGAIRIEAGGDGQVSVRATSDEPGDFTARVEQEGDTVIATVCCDGHCRGDRESGARDWNGRRECRGHVDFALVVLAGAQVLARNVSGAIEVKGVRGAQSLKNVSGPISTSGSEGPLHVKAVSGKVRIAPQRVARTLVKTVSGDIALALPRSAGANLSLKSVSGTLEGADREADRDGGRRWGRSARRQRRTVRGGGPELAFKTVSGSVKLDD